MSKAQELKKEIKRLENKTDQIGLGEYINSLYEELETLENQSR